MSEAAWRLVWFLPSSGMDVALGIEVAVLARAVVLRTEDVHLRALDVVLVAQPLADHAVSVGVQVVHAALIDGDLGFKIGELFGGNIGGVAEDTVLRRLSGIVVVGGQLNGIGNRCPAAWRTGECSSWTYRPTGLPSRSPCRCRCSSGNRAEGSHSCCSHRCWATAAMPSASPPVMRCSASRSYSKFGSCGGSQGSHWKACTRPWNSASDMGLNVPMSCCMLAVSFVVWKELSRLRS